MAHKGKILTYVIAGVVLGISIWLAEFGGWTRIRELIHPVTIHARSNSSGAENDFYANESIRFTLVGAKARTVFWIIDDQVFPPGPLAIDYRFQFQPRLGRGIPGGHSVLAVFEQSGNYDLSQAFYRTKNVMTSANIRIDSNEARITTQANLPTDWQLQRVSLMLANDFRFEDAPTAAIPVTTRGGRAEITMPATYVAHALGEPRPDDLAKRLALETDLWLKYDFADANQKQGLTLVQPLHATKKGM